MLTIVGVGICKGHITERAKEIIKKADVVYGSKKAIELVKEYINGKIEVMRKFDQDEFYKIENSAKNLNVVVLSTGDPMVSGLGTKIHGRVEPGISSVQIALAKLGVDLCDVVVVDAHAKCDIDFELLKHRHLLILADRKFDPSIFGHVVIKVIENICMENEKMFSCFADEIKLKSDYSIIFVKRLGGGDCEKGFSDSRPR